MSKVVHVKSYTQTMAIAIHRLALLGFSWLIALGVMMNGASAHNNSKQDDGAIYHIYLPVAYSSYKQFTLTPVPATVQSPTAIPTVPIDNFPPLARLSGEGGFVESGISTFCWWFGATRSKLCADSMYASTGHTPLVVSNKAEVKLNLKPRQSPDKISMTIMPVSSSDEYKTASLPWWRWWSYTRSLVSREIDTDKDLRVSLDLKNGLYVVLFNVVWDGVDVSGDVEYGFLLEVK